jgi:signal transduction histidine kinase
MNKSLARQLLLRMLAATGIALLATIGLLVWQFENSTQIALDRGLGDTLEEITANLSLDDRGNPVDTLSDEFRARFNDDLYFTVSDEQGRAYFSVPAGRAHTYHPFDSELADKPQFFEHNYLEKKENYLGVTARVLIGESTYWVQLVEEVPHWQNLVHFSIEVFLHGMGFLIVLHFFGSAYLAYRTVRASLEPVKQAASQAQAISPGRRDIRIDVAHLPSEVVPLAEAINTALERLEKALAAQKRFTADAAHELLTPLAVLKANIEIIEDAEITGPLSDDVEDMVGIVTQLLELSELESDEEIPGDLVDLRQIASDVLIKLAPLAIQHGIEPAMTGTGDPVLVRGSQKALAGVLGNLVTNAINHATGATRLEIAVEAGGRVSVIDDGPGIPEALRERVFERFHRAGNPKAGGRGLGLAIVRRVIEAHGGSVYVTDAPEGRGAAFVIELTVADQPE